MKGSRKTEMTRSKRSKSKTLQRKQEREFKIKNGFLYMLNEEEFYSAYSNHERAILSKPADLK